MSAALGSVGVFSTRLLTANEEMQSRCRYSHPIQWTGECELVFKQLKQNLVRAPIIAYADYTQRFIISTDANECGLGALLDQEQDGLEQVFGNASRSFHPSARKDANYSFLKLELVTMKRAVVEKMVGTTKNGHKNVEMRKMHHRLLKSIHHSLWNMNASAVFAVVRIIEGISLVHF